MGVTEGSYNILHAIFMHLDQRVIGVCSAIIFLNGIEKASKVIVGMLLGGDDLWWLNFGMAVLLIVAGVGIFHSGRRFAMAGALLCAVDLCVQVLINVFIFGRGFTRDTLVSFLPSILVQVFVVIMLIRMRRASP